MTRCNDGATVTRMGCFTHALEGTMFTGLNGFRSMNVNSEAEAEVIVIDLHGGKRF